MPACVLNGDWLVCLDLDHCYTGAVLAPWAASILDRIPPTYVERSPSGEGLHIWGFASLDFSGRRVAVPGGMMYAVGSGGTITGYGAGKHRPGFGGAILIDDPHKADEARSDVMRRRSSRSCRSRSNYCRTQTR